MRAPASAGGPASDELVHWQHGESSMRVVLTRAQALDTGREAVDAVVLHKRHQYGVRSRVVLGIEAPLVTVPSKRLVHAHIVITADFVEHVADLVLQL